MNRNLNKKLNVLPKSVGVYFFKDTNGRIVYIGKAIKLKNRVRSHFAKNGPNIFKGDFLKNIADIDWIKTTDERQALVLENQLIKKYQPRYNIQWRDDKSYFWVACTNEEWPRVKITHQTQLTTKNYKLKTAIGPFVNGQELKKVLRALRKIFPYRTCKNPYNKPCLQWHLGLCPAHYSESLIANSKSLNPPQSPFYKGERDTSLFKREVGRDFAKRLNLYKNSLNSLSQFLRLYAGEPIRIEAYDISNIHGQWATGSMIVFAGDKPRKSDYRRFKIKTVEGVNDAAMIKEVIKRRLKHLEWPYPDLIMIDGGLAQLNAALLITKNYRLKTNVVALAKQKEEIYTNYSKRTLRLKELPLSLHLTFQAIRDEAHRFAIFYYRHLHRQEIKTQPKIKNRRKLKNSRQKPGGSY